METIKVIHDTEGHTLTVWLGEPEQECICEETTEEVILMKDAGGRIIGFEMLHYHPVGSGQGLRVETVVGATL